MSPRFQGFQCSFPGTASPCSLHPVLVFVLDFVGQLVVYQQFLVPLGILLKNILTLVSFLPINSCSQIHSIKEVTKEALFSIWMGIGGRGSWGPEPFVVWNVPRASDCPFRGSSLEGRRCGVGVRALA